MRLSTYHMLSGASFACEAGRVTDHTTTSAGVRVQAQHPVLKQRWKLRSRNLVNPRRNYQKCPK